MAERSNESASRRKMGIATTSYMTARRPADTYDFLEYCHTLGAAGIQSPINGDLPNIRARAEQLGMYIEAMVPLPRGDDTSEFEYAVRDAKTVGAVALRAACLGGRRYETFSSLADWREFVSRSQESIEASLPVLEKYKIPLGLENHKDWTADEMITLIQKHSSGYFGVCLDFGNNISLLDNPMDVAERLAPYTVSTHLKDIAVESYSDGFLLSEVRLGEGFLELQRIVSMIHQSHPNTHLTLEMITRDPLKVPCLTDHYWITFPDRNGSYLARMLKLVQKKQRSALPHVSQLPHAEQLQIEEQNVMYCLDWANENLKL